MNAKFRVEGAFNGARVATVVINRGAKTISVRPLRRRKTYELPLSWAAEAVMWHEINREAREKRAAKGSARKSRRSRR